MKLKVYNKVGKPSKSTEIDDSLIKIDLNKDLISQVYRIQSLAKKKPVQTKDRSERRGGGRKPWRQKGTGRARHGSIRSPLWRKGGVTFGPRKEQNFKRRLNSKMKKKALLSLIADQQRNSMLIIIDELPNYKKTKKFEDYLLSLSPIKEPGSILMILDDKQIGKKRYLRNIPYLSLGDRSSLNVYNLLNHDYLIISKKILEDIFKVKKNDN
jgi:large subunit ribosomal protein L4